MADNKNFAFLTGLARIGSKLPKYLSNLANIGIEYEDDIDDKKLGVSRRDSEAMEDDDLYQLLQIANVKNINFPKDLEVPYFNKEYKHKIRKIREAIKHPEIEFILHTICNEAIVYDNYGFFCDVDIKPQGNEKFKEELKERIKNAFKRVYHLLKFDEDNMAWDLFLKFISEGHLAFEIVYDDLKNPTKIIGFNELQPNTLIPIVTKEEYRDQTGIKKTRQVRQWKQLVISPKNMAVVQGSNVRTLPDESVIFLSYSKTPGNKGRISYTERLMRSFNMLRTMENSTVAWYVMNAMYRMKFIIPVSAKNKNRAKSSLGAVISKYKENVLIDHDSGELMVDGKPSINFSRTIFMPSRQGQQPDIDSVEYRGPDLTRMDGVEYFRKKLQRDSNLPYSRFDRENGGGTEINFGSREISHDEKNYRKFVNRLRNEFKKLIIKPVINQLCMEVPELRKDPEFRSIIGVNYHTDFDQQQNIEKEKEAMLVERINTLTRIESRDPLFSRKWLVVDKFGILTPEEWEANQQSLEEETSENDGGY